MSLKLRIPSVAATLCALVLAVPGALAAQETRKISVTGVGEVATQPDMATLQVGVSQRDTNARAAMDAVSEVMTELLSRLEELGIEEQDVQTNDLNLRPVYDTSGVRESRPEISGYQATNTVMVRVMDLPQLGSVMQALLQDGANEFNGLQFALQDPRPHVDQAREVAVQDARARAELYAEAAGVGLGPLLELSEVSDNAPQPMMMDMAAARSTSVPVAQGQVSLSAQVHMVFSIADGPVE